VKPVALHGGMRLAAIGVLALHAAVGWGLDQALHPQAPAPAVRGIAFIDLARQTEASSSPVWPDLEAAPALLAVAGSGWTEVAPPEILLAPEVDESARPQTEWRLEAEDLEALGIQRLEFEVWVDAQAQITAVRVTHIEPPSAASLGPLLERRLQATPMHPALRDGKPVGQRLFVELGLSDPASAR
jgi:hypothetical protein